MVLLFPCITRIEEKIKADNSQITEQIREEIEKHDLDSDQEDKIKKLFEYNIRLLPERLRAIAKDVVGHFNASYKGKAMFGLWIR